MKLLLISLLLSACGDLANDYVMPDGVHCNTEGGGNSGFIFSGCTDGREYVNPPYFTRVK